MSQTNQKTILLHTTIHKLDCVIELTGIGSYVELIPCVRKVLGIPESHHFSEGYTIEIIDLGTSLGQTKSTTLTAQNFHQLKEKAKIKVVEKLTKEQSSLPVDYEKPNEYIGIHLKHASLTISKLPNVYVSFMFKKKPLRQASSSIKSNNQLPVWNENFMLPLIIESDSLINDRIQDSLIVKVVNTNEEKSISLGEGPLVSSRGKAEKEDVKEIFLTKFEVQLSHLKKGEPMMFKIDFKVGFVIVDMLWFEDNRTVLDSLTFHKSHGSQAISAGSTFFLPPPKDSYGKTIKRQELHWFSDLQSINSVESLRKGDILLGKYYLNNPIIDMQEDIAASRGSKYTCHVAIVCEDGANCIAEATPLRKFVSISPCFPEGDFIVYRASDQSYSKEAGDWAFDIATNYDVRYSIDKLSNTVNIESKNVAIGRQKIDLSPHGSNNNSSDLRSKKKLPNSMMSGQFVVSAYQCRQTPYIKLNSTYVSPMEFEDYLNQSPELFFFVGKLTQSAARKYNEDHNLKNIYEGNLFSPRSTELAELFEKGKT